METPVTPIAIIGMGCRLPGGIDSPEAFWQALLRGDDLVTEIPAERWDVEEHYDPERGVPGRSVSRWGGFIDDAGGFDASFFGFGEREATAIDPQHRLLLETSWEAIEHAGIAPSSLTGSRTGVFVGMCQQDYTLITGDAGALDDAYGYTCTPFSMASGRIAYGLGLRGPAITVDTSCSSGLIAVHMACLSLDRGESDLALAGGAMLVLDPRVSASASAQGMLSPTGRCHTFDAAADGFVRSDGCAVVLLKRLPDAMRDGDRILAVVRGTAANQDGRSETITTPSSDAQAAVYRAALAVAGVDAATVGMVEAHGTGTPVGDPLEFTSLAEIYGATGHRVGLGSAKSNLGHTESAAGAIGLMKAVLGVQHGKVPPMANFTRLPDELAAMETGLFVPREVTPWPIEGEAPRRAGVTSFGMTGTNVHAVLEQAPEEQAETQPVAGPMLFAVSSTSADELRKTAGRLAEWVEANQSVAASDLAYTLARRRGHRTVRTAVAAENSGELATALREIAAADTPYPPAAGHDDRGPVWIFSGQGSQWAAMGAELLAKEPAFAAAVAEAEPLIARESGFSVTEAMSAPETVTGIDRVQPMLFTFQVALATAMRAYGVRPAAVIGHSLGETSAAVIAGALSLEDGAKVICRRSRLMSRIAGAGAMASVELPAPQVQRELAARGVTDVVVAVIASPNSTVIGGATQTVREMVSEWESRDVMAREVAVDVASHSSQVDPILADLAEQLADLKPMVPEISYYSATLDDPRARPAFDAGYWVDNLRQSVKFANAVQAALDDGHRVFGEPSPHPLLTRAVEQTAGAADINAQALAAMRREQPMPHGLLGFLADLYSAGAAIDFSVLYPGGRLIDAPLPTWTHQRLLVGGDGSASHGQAHGQTLVPVHPLLGAHVQLPEEPERHAWQGEIGIVALPWLADHRVNGVAVLPGAAFCEMALVAAAVLGPDSEVRDVRFEQMLMLDDETPVAAVASVEDAGTADFVVETNYGGERIRRATAQLRTTPHDEAQQPQRRDIAALLATHPQRAEGAALRKSFEERGIEYGPAFTGLASARSAEGKGRSVVAELALPAGVRSQQAGYDVHPALLDACFQSVIAHSSLRDSDDGVLLPLSVRRLRRYAPTRGTRYCYLRVISEGGSTFEADLDLLDEDGAVLLAVEGLRMGSSGGGGDRLMNERLLTIDWQQLALPPVPERAVGNWLLINTSEADLLESALAEALKSLGAQCTNLNWAEGADHAANSAQLGAAVRGGLEGVVIVCPPPAGEPDEQGLLQGREQVRHVVRMIRDLPETQSASGESPRLYVVTRRAQIVLSDDQPNLVQAGLRGLLRVVGAENPELRVTQIDLDNDPVSEAAVEQVARELLTGSPEDETAWRGGERYAARLRCTPLGADDRRITTVKHESGRIRMAVRNPGDLQTLEFVALERDTPGPGEVEIAIHASSLNFLDVLGALGRLPDIEGRPHQLGFDLGGVITRVGADVTGHSVGDRVGGFAGYGNGCWGTFVTCDARLVATLPPGVTTVQAAAAAAAYGTAWYGLCDQARMTADDKVLIHSGTGGVGQAAIAVARLIGADVYATAGSPERRQTLRDMGIEHVYDSRSTEFAEQIRRDTDGYGVDIVLNSLTGAAQRAGLKLLASGGRFVEIGKRDIYGDTLLGLFPFRRNLTFYAVDLALLSQTHPRRLQDVLRTVYQRIADGELPLPAITEYPLSEASTAIRVMSGAEHTGKLVLTVPRAGETRAVVPAEQAPVFRDDGAYIVTGGLGGLGLFLATEMAKAGCGRIVLTARSAPTPKARQAIERIRATGVDIVVESGNIAEADTAARVVAVAAGTGLPLRGVLHAAAVVEDAVLANITDELIDRDWAPKVNGVWNLHHATAGQPLDWFCSFSSVAALFGSAGQGAYAAASSWLDGFTHWRRSQGLPTNTIAWGAWGEIGRATFLAAGGRTTMIAPDEGARAFETLLRYDRGYTGYVPTTGAPWLAALVARSPFAEAFKADGEQRAAESSTVRAELRTLAAEEWPARLRRLVAEQTGLILRRTVDPDRAFADHGLDSLGNVELRTRIEAETGIRITPKAIATYNTARALGLHLSEALAADGHLS
jgi:acyl transferase domain-containing protein/acyl carrier protein